MVIFFTLHCIADFIWQKQFNIFMKSVWDMLRKKRIERAKKCAECLKSVQNCGRAGDGLRRFKIKNVAGIRPPHRMPQAAGATCLPLVTTNIDAQIEKCKCEQKNFNSNFSRLPQASERQTQNCLCSVRRPWKGKPDQRCQGVPMRGGRR